MPKAPKKQSTVAIDAVADADRTFLLRPESNDNFIRTGKQVIAACSLGISIDLWVEEIKLMVQHVADWVKARSSSISACYVEPRPRCLMLIFVPKSRRFDFDLADQLVELNTFLIKNYSVGMVETHQVPDEELDRFLTPDMSWQIYGESRKPHQTVEA